MLNERCTRVVLKLKSKRGYKIYANDAVGVKNGGTTCGGTVMLNQKHEHFYGHDDSMFVGWVIKCSKCGDEKHEWSLDAVESMIEELENNG